LRGLLELHLSRVEADGVFMFNKFRMDIINNDRWTGEFGQNQSHSHY
jgi:hypothetical protein